MFTVSSTPLRVFDDGATYHHFARGSFLPPTAADAGTLDSFIGPEAA
jgi:hypothetical protein